MLSSIPTRLVRWLNPSSKIRALGKVLVSNPVSYIVTEFFAPFVFRMQLIAWKPGTILSTEPYIKIRGDLISGTIFFAETPQVSIGAKTKVKEIGISAYVN